MDFDGVVFPGQGTQVVGMGKDLVEFDPTAIQVFNNASDIVGFDVYAICQGQDDLLGNTEYTQPCILTLQIAMFKTLNRVYNFSPKFFAGHSLGEYAALVASKVIPFEVALKVVRLRGKLMQAVSSTEDLTGMGMVAIITDPMPLSELQNIAMLHKVDVANDNSLHQVVLSGFNQDLKLVLKELEQLFKIKQQIYRSVPLAVKAAFHSRYMQQIELDFYNYILQFEHSFNPRNLGKVISNYFGGFYPELTTNSLINGLTKQISGSVKWRENMLALLSKTKNIIELGSAAPLRGFFKTLGVTIHSITNIKSISKVFEHDFSS